MRVSVVGGSVVPDPVESIAEDLGRLLAQRGHTVVCGGLGGVMKAACRGAKDAGGTTIGVLPGEDREDANSYVDISIATGLGHARNALVAMNGGGGTLSEIGYANVFDRPTAGIRTQQVGSLEGFEPCDSPEAAVAFVEDAV
ncbi:SLOG cluster 4 domain-containing protein [Haloferax volcanii]|uniref:Rossmann fold nucleotide-binding protein n=1 Tax=Haloferax volcanii TaxID=2246 RepID=A0A847TT66_HALVO|nr:Rossmann fold nucleotide-binding protein [Haloferax alexandrinus]